MKGSNHVEEITDAEACLYSPFSNSLGEIYFACENGTIIKYKDGQKVEVSYLRSLSRSGSLRVPSQWTLKAKSAISQTWGPRVCT